MAGKSRRKSSMTDEHLQALAKGRSEGAVVRRYLVALENHRPKRGRKRTPESMKKRLNEIQQMLADVDPLTRVHLMQERIDLQNSMQSQSDGIDIKALEDEFVKAAKTYGERKRISYAAWREAGVDANILRRAGIARSA